MRMTGPSPALSASTAKCRDRVVFPAPPFCEARTMICIPPSATPWARTAAGGASRTDGPTASRATCRQSIRSCGYPSARGCGAQYSLLCLQTALRNSGPPQALTYGEPHVRNHALPIPRKAILAEVREFARWHYPEVPRSQLTAGTRADVWKTCVTADVTHALAEADWAKGMAWGPCYGPLAGAPSSGGRQEGGGGGVHGAEA